MIYKIMKGMTIMTIEERNREIDSMKLIRNSKGILEFGDLEKAISKIKTNPDNYDYELKKLLVENLYENIKFISGLDKNRLFFEKIGINNKMSLDSEKDVEILYNFLVNLVNSYTRFAITFAFYNHKSQEDYRKDLKDDDNIDEITEDTFWYFVSEWDFLNSVIDVNEE